jgi:prevent-host-death family protein
VTNTIGQRELRNDSGEIMRRVEQGESFVVTRNGVPIADLSPHTTNTNSRRRFVPVEEIESGLGAIPDWGAASFREEVAALDGMVNDDPDDDAWTPRS